MTKKTTYVTRPFLPPIDEFIPFLEEIWESRVLTNGGPFHQRLEQELAQYLGVNHVALFTNGTLALLCALQSMRISGEVITTPFSFVATSHSLLWNNVKPVFVDIDENTLNLDPSKIEQAITPSTTAILAVHCYGHPCNVEEIQRIADIHNLKVIYDAAHAFGVNCDCGSILNHGDLSVLSFHATKVFNTFEGGAIICPDEKSKTRIDYIKNFGHSGEEAVVSPGINGKMSEINAALGLVQLRHVDEAIDMRGSIDKEYRGLLSELSGLSFVDGSQEIRRNFSYFPIRISASAASSRDVIYNALKEKDIHPRKYFYPLISEFPMYRSLSSANPANLPVATKAADEVLCLPIYPDLELSKVHEICSVISLCLEE